MTDHPLSTDAPASGPAPDPSGPDAAAADVTEVDVLVVGAGISGIDVAYRLAEQNPELRYLVVERRARLGGTWDLFRYPGIRSDSDVFTLAYPFLPWQGAHAIVQGQEILDYLGEAVRRFGIEEHLRFDTHVHHLAWDGDTHRWTVEATSGGKPVIFGARFVVMATGYYDYDTPHDPGFVGTEDFEGHIVHPQFWPEDLDVTGARAAVVGSGATAITLVPSLVAAGSRVTMLQRTPGYVLAQPRRDAVADALRRVLPASAAHHVVRAKNTLLQVGLYQACRRAPGTMRAVLRGAAAARLGSRAAVDAHFDPPYDPWDQRLCIAPDGDFFTALRSGRAEVVTGAVERFGARGIRLTHGRLVEADVVVTATGLSLRLLGGASVSVDGRQIDPSQTVTYRGAMLSGVPNLAFVVGYVNLSWTMRADMTARLVARIVRRLTTTGALSVTPVVPADTGPLGPVLDMESGYIARAADSLPRAAKRDPWTLRQNYVRDAWATERADLDDGLEWERGSGEPLPSGDRRRGAADSMDLPVMTERGECGNAEHSQGSHRAVEGGAGRGRRHRRARSRPG